VGWVAAVGGGGVRVLSGWGGGSGHASLTTTLMGCNSVTLKHCNIVTLNIVTL